MTYTGNGVYLLKPSVNVTTNVAATTCASVSGATYNCAGTAVAAGGTLVANTWYKVTSNPTLTYTSNGNVSYKVVDGTNETETGSTNVSGIDRDVPETAAIFSATSTTKVLQ